MTGADFDAIQNYGPVEMYDFIGTTNDRIGRWPFVLVVSLALLLAADGNAVETAVETVAEMPDGDWSAAESLAEKLTAAVDSPINVELKSGQTFVRAKLIRVNADRKKTKVVSLALLDPDNQKPKIVSFAAIHSISINHEKVYEASASARTPAERRMQQELAKAAQQRAQWIARAKQNKIAPWPELTREQHEATVEEFRKLIESVSDSMPNLKLHETQEFLFCSNIPDNQIAPYISALDKMHDLMCEMYGIKQGEPVWKGKCLVMAFLNQAEFLGFEKVFLKNADVPAQVYGLCHSYSNGKVIMSCYRGDDPNEFAKMLVHETSHGFIHRYRTPVRLPTWVNEGMADWIAAALVTQDKTVQRRQQEAISRMYRTHSMGDKFLNSFEFIEPWQYGTASSITDYLIRRDRQGYTKFIQGMKEGLKWPDSLQAAFKITPDQLVAGYGQAIGVADLK
ncbi:MAG: hypothetical protein IT427_06415 [Pirellulales bacterium]|nr:hypothetical protein [Pirellulales bacterium]